MGERQYGGGALVARGTRPPPARRGMPAAGVWHWQQAAVVRVAVYIEVYSRYNIEW